MPVNVVKTKRDEHLWSKAKVLAKKQYPNVPVNSDQYWSIVMGIYKQSKGLNKSIRLIIKSRKLHYKTEFQGLPISIENRKGSIRRGKDKNGEWQTKMKYPYGYIRGTVGHDGDQIDCFIGDDKDSERVYIIHINKPDNGKYDEDKVFLGFETFKAAMNAFKRHYEDWEKYYQGFDIMDIETFKDKINNKGKKIEKSHVRGHTRTTRSGKVVPVRDYENRKTKKQNNSGNYFKSKIQYLDDKPSKIEGYGKGLRSIKHFGRIFHSCTLDGLANLLNNKSDVETCFSTGESKKLFGREIVIVLKDKERKGKYTSYDSDAGKNFGYDEFRTKFNKDDIETIFISDRLNDIWNNDYDENDESEEAEEYDLLYELAEDYGIKYSSAPKSLDKFLNINPINKSIHYIIKSHGNSGKFDPTDPDITKSFKYIFKSHVKAHNRTTKTGKIVSVRDYINKKKKKTPETKAGKRPWQMTRDEFIGARKVKISGIKGGEKISEFPGGYTTGAYPKAGYTRPDGSAVEVGKYKYSAAEWDKTGLKISDIEEIGRRVHKEVIQRALAEDKTVPTNILKDHPELAQNMKPVTKSIGESIHFIIKSFSSAMQQKYPGGKWVTITDQSSPLHGRHIFIVPHKDGSATIAWAPGHSGLTHKVLHPKSNKDQKPKKDKPEKERHELSEEQRKEAIKRKEQIETAQKQTTEEFHSKIREKLGIKTEVTQEEKNRIEKQISKIADRQQRNIERLKQYNRIKNERDKAIDEVIGEAKKAMLGEDESSANLSDEKKRLREIIKENAEEFLKYHYQIKAYMREKKAVSNILRNKTRYSGGSDIVDIKPLSTEELKHVLIDEKAIEMEIDDHYRLIINTRGGISQNGEEIRGQGAGSETIAQNIVKGGFEAMTGITGEAAGSSIMDLDTYRLLGSNNAAILMNYYLENSIGSGKYAEQIEKLKKYIQNNGQKVAQNGIRNGDIYIQRAQKIKRFGYGEDALFGDRVQANATALQYIQRAYESYGQAEGALNQSAELLYQFENKKRNIEFTSGRRERLNAIRDKLKLNKSDADIRMLEDRTYKMNIRPSVFEKLIKEKPVVAKSLETELSAADIKAGKANTADYCPDGLKPYLPPDRNGVSEKLVLGDHQQSAARLLSKEKRVYLNFEAGTGKSASYIASIAEIKEKTGKMPKTIISMPKKLMPNFADEVRKFSEFNVVIVDSDDKNKRKKLYNGDPNTIVLVNKEKYLFDHDLIKNAGFDMMIVDEAHRSGQRENRSASGMSKGLAELARGMEYFIAGSGSPTPNDLSELFFYLKTIDPVKFDNQKAFMEKYRNLHRGAGYKEMLAEILHKEIDDRVFTVKKDLQHSFRQHIHNAKLSDIQRRKYKNVMADYRAKKIDVLERDRKLNNILNSTKYENNHKFDKMGEIIDNHMKSRGSDEKIIIYAQQYSTVNEIERYLKKKYQGAGIVRFDGKTKLNDIDANKKLFKTDKNVRFAIHTDAGTEGLNLQYTGKPGEMGATTAIAMASGANSYSTIDQFFSRANRTGVPKSMNIDGHLILTDTPHDIRTETRLEDKKSVMNLLDNAKYFD